MNQFKKGQLYQYDGQTFKEIEPQEGKKIPISDEAFDIVKNIRAVVSRTIGMRPELSIVASALLISSANLPDLADKIRAYGARLYAGTTE